VRILGLDSATRATSVAVCELAGEDRAPRELRSALELRDDPAPGERPAHARALLALACRALAESGLGWSQIDQIVVGTGPGGFTGLRIGIATAQGLASSRGLALHGVSSLRALALGAREAARERRAERICAVIDARRGEVFAATWSAEDDAVASPLRAPAALAPERLARELASGPPTLAIGDGALAFRVALERAAALVPGEEPGLHLVSAIQHCRLAAGPGSPPEGVLPQYLRLPDAELARRSASR
jgi:tRNA threonylcarbamoyladenosine biosynthesis protein TsaB